MNTKNNKIIRIKFSDEELIALESVLKFRSITSPHMLVRILVLEEYKKEKKEELLYGRSPSSKNKQLLSEKLNEIRAMSDEEATKYFLSLGYEDFHGDKPVNPDDFPSTSKYSQRRMIRSAIKTLPNGVKEFVKHYFDELEPNVIKDTYDTSYDLENLLKKLLKLKLIK